MADTKLTPIGNVSIVTGQYEKDGETKNRYLQIGTLFERVGKVGHVIKLDAYPPTNSDGQIWMNVWPIHKGDDAEGDQTNTRDDSDKPKDPAKPF